MLFSRENALILYLNVLFNRTIFLTKNSQDSQDRVLCQVFRGTTRFGRTGKTALSRNIGSDTTLEFSIGAHKTKKRKGNVQKGSF